MFKMSHETGSQLRVSSDRLVEPEIELGTPGYMGSGINVQFRNPYMLIMKSHYWINWKSEACLV